MSGISGSTFYCQGIRVSNPPPIGGYNCGGIMYNYGAIANGYINGTFYCNGIPTQNISGYINCGGTTYYNGFLYSGYFV